MLRERSVGDPEELGKQVKHSAERKTKSEGASEFEVSTRPRYIYILIATAVIGLIDTVQQTSMATHATWEMLRGHRRDVKP